MLIITTKNCIKIFNTLSKIILAAVFLMFFSISVSAQLSYAEGGPALEDPGASLNVNLRRYVDAINGNDNNDGMSQGAAWKTHGKVSSERSSFQPGTHILFKRGQTWTGGSFSFENVNGTSGNRIVLGAYGLPLTSKPNIQANISLDLSSYIMMREFDSVKISASDGSHHIIIYDNEVHGQAGNFPSNGIKVFGASHHISIVGNLVYDLSSNDCITIHGDGAGIGPEDGHWVLDNTVIGNSGMEDGIDIALTDYEALGQSQQGDVKVIANRIQMNSLSGLSTKSGRGSKCINSGHDGRYFWYVGNIMAGSSHIGFNLGINSSTQGAKKFTYITGNVAFDNAKVSIKPSLNILQDESYMDHNTIIHTVEHRQPALIGGTGSSFTNNLLMRIISGSYISGSVPTMQNNVSTMNVSGIEVPPNSSFNNDPRNWFSASFLDYFTPDNSWSEINGVDTPGAFGPNDSWLGLTIQPFPGSGLQNNGLGWEGPALVQERLTELGITFGDSTLEVNEFENSNDIINIYPNPTTNKINIQFSKSQNVENVSIYNILGKKVFSKKVASSKTELTLKPNLTKGIYIIKINSEKGSISKKIIIE